VNHVEQPACCGLLDESVKDIVDNVFKIGGKLVNRISGWRFVESEIVSDKAVLDFVCERGRVP
jgi:hypothetical protein